jgi:Tol biopolymer transport system component
MKVRDLVRSAVWIVAVLVCATWLLASSRVWLNDDDPPQYSEWSAPVNLGPAVNWLGKSDQQPCISKDGLSLYFASGRPGGFGDFDIYVSQRASVNDPWGTPQNLGPNVNSPYREFYPSLSPDGHSLYFSSLRPGGFGNQDIYVSRRHNKRDDFGWQPAVNLGSAINTAFGESFPFLFEDDETGGITLFFSSNRPGGMGATDIYASTLQPDETFGIPVPVTELNSPFADIAPNIRRDGLELFLCSNRPGSLGDDDLWVSTRPSTSDPWSTPVNLGPLVNSVLTDNAPALSFKGTELYFTSTRLGGPEPQDLWVSRRFKLKQPD